MFFWRSTLTVRECCIVSISVVFQLFQSSALWPGKDQQCPLLPVVWTVGVDVDINTGGTHQLRVDCSGLALHLSRVFDNVNLDWKLQPGYEVSDGGQGDMAAVTEEFSWLVADITGLSLLVEQDSEQFITHKHCYLQCLQHLGIIYFHHRKWVLLLQHQLGTGPSRVSGRISGCIKSDWMNRKISPVSNTPLTRIFFAKHQNVFEGCYHDANLKLTEKYQLRDIQTPFSSPSCCQKCSGSTTTPYRTFHTRIVRPDGYFEQLRLQGAHAVNPVWHGILI